MKHFFIFLFIPFIISCEASVNPSADSIQKKQECMDIPTPSSNWKKVSLTNVMEGLEISLPPKAVLYYDCSYECQFAVYMDSTNTNTGFSIYLDKKDELGTVKGIREWLHSTSRKDFHYLHDCNKEVIVRLNDPGAGLQDNTSFNSFAEKEIGKRHFSFYADGITVNDLSEGDFFKLTLEDNITIVRIFKSLKIKE